MCGFIEFLGLAFSGTNLEFSRDWNIRWTSLVAQKIGLREYFEVCISGIFLALGQIFDFFDYSWGFVTEHICKVLILDEHYCD